MTLATRPNRIRSPFVGLLIVLSMLILGYVVGMWLARSEPVPEPVWKQWVAPPERVSKIESMYQNDVYLTTITGEWYECDPLDCRLISAQDVRQLPSLCDSHLFEPPSAPGIVSAALELCQMGGEFTTQINLVALSDGRLWVWSKSATWSDHLAEFILGWAGAGIGLVLGLVIVAVIRLSTRPADEPAPRPAQILGRLLLGGGTLAALIMILFGEGVQFRWPVVLAVAGAIGLGSWLLVKDKHASVKV